MATNLAYKSDKQLHLKNFQLHAHSLPAITDCILVWTKLFMGDTWLELCREGELTYRRQPEWDE